MGPFHDREEEKNRFPVAQEFTLKMRMNGGEGGEYAERIYSLPRVWAFSKKAHKSYWSHTGLFILSCWSRRRLWLDTTQPSAEPVVFGGFPLTLCRAGRYSYGLKIRAQGCAVHGCMYGIVLLTQYHSKYVRMYVFTVHNTAVCVCKICKR